MCKIVREEFDRGYAEICLESEDKELPSVYNCIIISIISDYACISPLMSILPTFFTTCFHAQALPLPTRNCILNSDGQGSACGLAGLRRGLTGYSCRGTSPVNLAIFLKGIGAEMNELHPYKV